MVEPMVELVVLILHGFGIVVGRFPSDCPSIPEFTPMPVLLGRKNQVWERILYKK
jgi:hypothetical protein